MDHVGRIAQELILAGIYFPEVRVARLRVVHDPGAPHRAKAAGMRFVT